MNVHDNRKPPSRGRIVALLLILIFVWAFALRFIFFYQMARSPITDMLSLDSEYYNNWAKEIAEGNWIGNEVFLALPGYPYFLGSIYAVFGPHLLVVKFIQVLLGTLNCYLIFCLGRRFFNVRIGLLAAFFMAAYKWLILNDCAILSPVLVVFFNCSVLLCLLNAKDKRKGWRNLLATGFLTGIAAATSANIMMFVPMVLIWLLADRAFRPWPRATAITMAFVVGVTLPIALIAFRNWYVGKDFIPLTAHGGINFFIGNNAQSQGIFEPPPGMRGGGTTMSEDSAMIAQKALGRSLKPSEVSSYWFNQGLKFVKEQPARYLHLLLRKFAIFWDGIEIADVVDPSLFEDYAPVLKLPMFNFRMVAPMALLGIVLSWRQRRKLLLLYLFVAAYTVSVILLYVNARYRLPLVPFLMLFAAYAFHWWWEKAQEKRFRRILFSLALLAVFALFVNPLKPRIYPNLGAGHNHIGSYFSAHGDTERALVEYKKAVELEPMRAEAHSNLGNVYFTLKKYDLALMEYRESIRIDPGIEGPYNNLGLTHEELGQIQEAAGLYEQMIRAFPQNVAAPLRLAQIYLNSAETDKAVNVLKSALANNAGAPDLYAALAKTYLGTGSLDEAAATVRKGLLVVPGSTELRALEQNLMQPYSEAAMAHVRAGRFQEARKVLQREIEIHPANTDALIKLSSVLLNLKEYGLAIDTCRKALELKPDDAGIWSNLGYAYALSGNKGKAIEAWKESLRLDPSQPNIKQQLEALEQ